MSSSRLNSLSLSKQSLTWHCFGSCVCSSCVFPPFHHLVIWLWLWLAKEKVLFNLFMISIVVLWSRSMSIRDGWRGLTINLVKVSLLYSAEVIAQWGISGMDLNQLLFWNCSPVPCKGAFSRLWPWILLCLCSVLSEFPCTNAVFSGQVHCHSFTAREAAEL